MNLGLYSTANFLFHCFMFLINVYKRENKTSNGEAKKIPNEIVYFTEYDDQKIKKADII